MHIFQYSVQALCLLEFPVTAEILKAWVELGNLNSTLDIPYAWASLGNTIYRVIKQLLSITYHLNGLIFGDDLRLSLDMEDDLVL